MDNLDLANGYQSKGGVSFSKDNIEINQTFGKKSLNLGIALNLSLNQNNQRHRC
jgi:hypothetical protein